MLGNSKPLWSEQKSKISKIENSIFVSFKVFKCRFSKIVFTVATQLALIGPMALASSFEGRIYECEDDIQCLNLNILSGVRSSLPEDKKYAVANIKQRLKSDCESWDASCQGVIVMRGLQEIIKGGFSKEDSPPVVTGSTCELKSRWEPSATGNSRFQYDSYVYLDGSPMAYDAEHGAYAVRDRLRELVQTGQCRVYQSCRFEEDDYVESDNGNFFTYRILIGGVQVDTKYSTSTSQEYIEELRAEGSCL